MFHTHMIFNPHRDAYQKLTSLCLNPNISDLQWGQLVENTNWLSIVRLILSASWQTAFHVHINRLPVLIHCSVSYFLLTDIHIFQDSYEQIPCPLLFISMAGTAPVKSRLWRN
jgi:hypothetical protein